MNERITAEKEANRDLVKPIEQLLADIHEEINDNDRNIDENVAHAQKRFYSLVANIALSNNKLSKRVQVLTIIAVVFAAIQVLPLIISFFSWLSKQG